MKRRQLELAALACPEVLCALAEEATFFFSSIMSFCWQEVYTKLAGLISTMSGLMKRNKLRKKLLKRPRIFNRGGLMDLGGG